MLSTIEAENQAIESELNAQNDSPFYSKLPAEIRKHILSYVPRPSMYNFARSSKISNREIQKFNEYPVSISLTEHYGHAMFELTYKKGPIIHILPGHYGRPQSTAWSSLWNWLRGGESVVSHDQVMMNSMLKALGDKVENCQPGRIECIVINSRTWPIGITRLPMVQFLVKWEVNIQDSMFEDFMEDMSSHTMAKEWKIKIKSTLSCRNQTILLESKFFKEEVRHLRLELWTPETIEETQVTHKQMNSFFHDWHKNGADDEYHIAIQSVSPFDKSAVLMDLPVQQTSDEKYELRKGNVVSLITVQEKNILFKVRNA